MGSKKFSEWNQGYFPATAQSSIHPEIRFAFYSRSSLPPWLPHTDLKDNQTKIGRSSNELLTVTQQKNKNPSVKGTRILNTRQRLLK